MRGRQVRLVGGPRDGVELVIEPPLPRVLDFPHQDNPVQLDPATGAVIDGDITYSLARYEHVPWVRAMGVPAGFPGYEQYRYSPLS